MVNHNAIIWYLRIRPLKNLVIIIIWVRCCTAPGPWRMSSVNLIRYFYLSIENHDHQRQNLVANIQNWSWLDKLNCSIIWCNHIPMFNVTRDAPRIIDHPELWTLRVYAKLARSFVNSIIDSYFATMSVIDHATLRANYFDVVSARIASQKICLESEYP